MRKGLGIFRIPSILLAGVLILFLTNCSNSELDPIFYTLENEEPITDSGLENNITVHRLVRAGGSYFAAAGRLYSRSVTGEEWSEVSLAADALCNRLESFTVAGSEYLYAGFYDKEDNSPLGLWRKPLNGSWGRDSASTIPSDAQVIMLKAVNNRLFISTEKDQRGALYYYDTSGFRSSITLPSELDGENILVRDITHDGSDYWLVAGTYLCSTSDPAAGFSLVAGDPSTGIYGGVYYADALTTPNLYLSALDGRVYGRDGAVWTASEQVEVGNDTVKFSEIIGVGSNRLLVGTQAFGYYDLQGGNPAALFQNIEDRRSPDYNLADLYKGAVLSFAVYGEIIFACTAGTGLWRSDNAGDNWNRE